MAFPVEMNFVRFAIPPLVFFFRILLASQVVCSSKQAALKKDNSNIENLKDDVIRTIGEFLICPQKELGFVSKRFYRFFFHTFPYCKLLCYRHGIPELQNAETEEDLSIPFKNLAHIKDFNHLFMALSNLVFQTDCFTANKKLLMDYVVRTYQQIDPKFFNALGYTGSRDKVIIAGKILELNNYTLFLEFIAFHPELLNEHFKNMKLKTFDKVFDVLLNSDAKSVYRKLKMISNEEGSEILISASMRVGLYQHLLQSTTDIKSKSNFISASMITGIPEEFYLNELLESFSLFQFTLKSTCTEFINEKLLRKQIIYELNSRLIEHFDVSRATESNAQMDEYIAYAKILNHVRFGPEESGIYESDIIPSNIQNQYKMIIMLAAALANKFELVLKFYEHLKGLDVDFKLEASNMKNGFGIFLSIFKIWLMRWRGRISLIVTSLLRLS